MLALSYSNFTRLGTFRLSCSTFHFAWCPGSTGNYPDVSWAFQTQSQWCQCCSTLGAQKRSSTLCNAGDVATIAEEPFHGNKKAETTTLNTLTQYCWVHSETNLSQLFPRCSKQLQSKERQREVFLQSKRTLKEQCFHTHTIQTKGAASSSTESTGFSLKLFSVLVQTKPESTNLEQGGATRMPNHGQPKQTQSPVFWPSPHKTALVDSIDSC